MTENRRSIYPCLIALLLATFLVFLAWSANSAATGGSRITDPDYYSKGLKYNTTLVEKRAATVLGWQLRSSLQGRHLEVTLLNKGRQPVSGAQATLHLNVADNTRFHPQPLKETSAGHYQVLLPAELHGQLQAEIEIEREGARLNRHLLINL